MDPLAESDTEPIGRLIACVRGRAPGATHYHDEPDEARAILGDAPGDPA